MTARVIECRSRLEIPGAVASREVRRGSSGSSSGRGFKLAALTAVLVVPIAGAAEPPNGWTVAGLTALAVVALVPLIGGRVHWGWLALLAGAAGIVTPRGNMAAIGPGLFVATLLCLVLWLANRQPGQREDRRRPRPGSRERDAQLVMGLSGERHVGDVLARELADGFVLINGLKLPRGAGDIDHLVVGPTGVFLLETKTMAGRIVCEPDGTWRRTRVGRAGTPYAAYIGDPAAQVQRNIFAVRDRLRLRLPHLFRGTPLWIEGLVVFPHPRTQLEAEHSRVPAVRLDQATSNICLHVPRRPLHAHEIDAVVDALLTDAQARGQQITSHAQSAQALIELALALPLVLVLVFGAVGVSRLIRSQTAVVAVAHEVARAGALGTSPGDAVERMRRRVELVAPGLGLDPLALVLDWDVSTFTADRGHVVARVRYPVDLSDLPLVSWVPAAVVRAEHAEWVDPFRSGLAAPVETAP